MKLYCDFLKPFDKFGDRKKEHWEENWKKLADVIHRYIQDEQIELVTDESLATHQIIAHTDRLQKKANLYAMQMHMSGLFSVDRCGWGVTHSQYRCNNFTSKSANDSRSFCENLSEGWLKTGKSKFPQPAPKIASEKNYIFLPLQMPMDTVVCNYGRCSMEKLAELVSAWAELNKINVLAKLHPASVGHPHLSSFVEKIKGLKRKHFQIVNGNVHSLIKGANCVFTINSGTGFEALAHGKPVVTFGQADYDICTYNADPRTLLFSEESTRILNFIEKSPKQISGYKFVDYYLNNWCYNLSEPSAGKRLMIFLKDNLS